MLQYAPLPRVVTQRSGTIPKAETSSPRSPKQESKIWKAALQRYYDELANGGYKCHAINKDLWDIKTPEELLNEIKTLPASGKGPEDLNILKKVLGGLSDFAAVAA